MNGAPNPTEALAVSRERLRQAWLRTAPGTATGPARVPDRNPDGAPLPLAAAPATLAAALLHHWWRQHPWRQAGALAVQTADTLARPVAQAHPVAWVAGGAAAGALLVALRPWRLLRGAWGPAVLPSVLPGLLQALLRPPSR